MKKRLSALFVGLGSIGSRHIKNLAALCAQRDIDLCCHALRHDLTAPLRAGVPALLNAQFDTLADPAALPHYDVAFITNPTALHAKALQLLRGRADTLFIEKPILSAEQATFALDALLDAGQKAYVAAPMRFCAVMLAVQDWLRQHPAQRIFCARAICSSYLPDWRPGVDYRTVYSAHRDMGGGVTIDLIHEWDYLVHLFGRPSCVYNLRGTYSALEIDSDDLSVYIARYPGMLAELHLDYFGRTYRRSLELFTKDGSLIADFGGATLTLPDGTVQEFRETTDAWYHREMDYFLDYALAGAGDSINSPADALAVLRLSLGMAED